MLAIVRPLDTLATGAANELHILSREVTVTDVNVYIGRIGDLLDVVDDFSR